MSEDKAFFEQWNIYHAEVIELLKEELVDKTHFCVLDLVQNSPLPLIR